MVYTVSSSSPSTVPDTGTCSTDPSRRTTRGAGCPAEAMSRCSTSPTLRPARADRGHERLVGVGYEHPVGQPEDLRGVAVDSAPVRTA